VLAAANWPLLTGGATVLWDADAFFAPYYTLVADHARAGRLLLWDPWTEAGYPAGIDPEIGALSPLVVGLAFLTGGSLAGFCAFWLLAWLAGGLGMLVLAMHLGAPPWGAFVTALGFVFSGFYAGHAEHTSFVQALSLLPWVVWRLDVALTTGRAPAALGAGALLGLGALSAYPGLVITHALWLGLWALGRAAWPVEVPAGAEARPPGAPVPGAARAGRALAGVVLTGTVAGVVALPLYAGFLVEARGYADRATPLARSVAVGSNALHPGALSSFASPHIPMLAREGQATLWPETDVSSVSVYVGVLVTWLALLALWARPASRWRWWLVALGALWLALAVGPALPLRGLLYDWFPPSRFFRHAAMLRAYAIFAACVLAALGSADLGRHLGAGPRLGRTRLVGAALIVAAGAWVAYVTVFSRAPRTDPLASDAALHVGLAWAAVVLLAVWLAAGPAGPGGRGLRLAGWALCALAVADALWSHRLGERTVYTSDPRVLAGWEILTATHRPGLDLAGDPGTRRAVSFPIGPGATNKHLVPKVPVLSAYATLGSDRYRRFVAAPTLRALALGPDRLWWSADPPVAPAGAPTLEALVRRAGELGAAPVVVHSRAEMRAPGAPAPGALAAIAAAGPAVSVAAELRAYSPTELAFRVVAPGPGWLVVTDRWAPGWRATVDGRGAEVWGAWFAFRAVRLGPGPHEVRFVYRPFGYPGLVWLSWSTLGAVLLGGALGWRRRATVSRRLA
jgi:hypothetical protein